MALWRAVQQFWLWGQAASSPSGDSEDTGGTQLGDSGQGAYTRDVHIIASGSGYHLG